MLCQPCMEKCFSILLWRHMSIAKILKTFSEWELFKEVSVYITIRGSLNGVTVTLFSTNLGDTHSLILH